MKEFEKTRGGEGCAEWVCGYARYEVRKSQPECRRKFRLRGFPGLIN